MGRCFPAYLHQESFCDWNEVMRAGQLQDLHSGMGIDMGVDANAWIQDDFSQAMSSIFRSLTCITSLLVPGSQRRSTSFAIADRLP